MTSDQIQWLALGALGALLLALPLALRLLRGRATAAHAAGAASREPELVASMRDLAALQRERDALNERVGQAEVQLSALRTRVDQLSDERATLAARAERGDGMERQLATLRGELDQSRMQRMQAEARVAEQAARLEEQQRAAEARYRELERAREQLKTEFQALAGAILDDKSRRFGEAQQAEMGQLLTPLREQLGDFRRAVNEAYEKENNARVALQTRIDDLVRLNQSLGQEAQSLSRALNADNRSQGYWGELKLERLLESAGLEKGQQYLTQESFRDGDGERYRPDALLRLPEDRHIVIDAKMVMVDYQRACDEADPALREAHLARHVAALRTHVRQLGEKDYSRLEGVNSPDLVLLFVPVEGAFLEALRRDTALYEFAFEKKIILVGPSNLLASLRLVAQVWRTEQQNRNATKIADRAAALYDKFVGFAEDMSKIGDTLEKARSAHEAAMSKLSKGRGNLAWQVEKLRELGVAPTKRLPPALRDVGGEDDGGPDPDVNDPTADA